jgi:CheY-like chemotaxis protein
MSAPSAQPPRVLVVAADSGLQNTFEVLLSEEGYEPHVVATLDEALARVDETPFSLILVDLFDDTSPLALTPTHVLQPGGEPIPIGLLTTSSRSTEEAHAAGYAFVVPMPFDLATFLAQIAAALDAPRLGGHRPRSIATGEWGATTCHSFHPQSIATGAAPFSPASLSSTPPRRSGCCSMRVI